MFFFLRVFFWRKFLRKVFFYSFFFRKFFSEMFFFRESQMSLRNSTKFCTEVRKVTKKKERTRALKKKKKKLLDNTIPFKNYKNCIQDAIDRLKKGKAKDSSGVRAEELQNCSDITKEKSGRSSMKSHD